MKFDYFKGTGYLRKGSSKKRVETESQWYGVTLFDNLKAKRRV